MKVLMLYKTGE